MFFKYAFDIFIILAGLMLILGTILKWKVLVDPPEKWAPYYSHSKLKTIFGSNFLIPFNYFVGTALLLYSLISLVNRIAGI